MGPMTARAFHAQLAASVAASPELELLTYADAISYDGRTYPFSRVASRGIASGDRVLLFRASFHGDEPRGARFFLNHLPQIAEMVHGRGLKFIAYPLANPCGFEEGVRDGGNRNEGYDDWVRYIVAGKGLADELHPGDTCRAWFRSSDSVLHATLAQETALMHECVVRDLRLNIAAAIDFHEHVLVKEGDECAKAPGAYAYAFGADHTVYDSIVCRIERRCPMLRNTRIHARETLPLTTDSRGIIWDCCDGSFADFMRLVGAESIVAEVTGATADADAEEVYLAWIDGIAARWGKKNRG